jgi:ATP-dependent DNA ligase
MIELKPQKALHLHEAQKVKKFRFGEYAVMEKLDGWYCYIDCIDGKWDVLRSRVGREVPAFTDISKFLVKIGIGSINCRFIFEATIPGTNFHEANGIFNRKSEQAQGVTLYFHDLVDLDNHSLDFETRYSLGCKILGEFFQVCKQTDMLELANRPCNIAIVPVLRVADSEEESQELFQEVTRRGGEGIILKDLNSGYHFGKRNSTLLKIKEEITKDFEVVGLAEGEGKYLGTLGALQVRGKNGVVIEVSGMSDWERNVWWGNPAMIIGKVVEVVAMKELPNGSLREPRYKSIRFDKDIGDID